MLLMAMKRKSPPELKKAIEECEEAEYPELNEELRKARDILENLSGSSGGQHEIKLFTKLRYYNLIMNNSYY